MASQLLLTLSIAVHCCHPMARSGALIGQPLPSSSRRWTVAAAGSGQWQQQAVDSGSSSSSKGRGTDHQASLWPLSRPPSPPTAVNRTRRFDHVIGDHVT